MARNQITTVDIGTNSVKALQLEITDTDLKIVNYGVESYPRKSAGERISDISDDVIMDTLSQLMRRKLFKTKPVAMSIPRHLVTIKNLSGLPDSANRDDIDKMVPIQVGPELPFPINESIYDSYNIQRSTDGVSLEVVATKKSSVERYTQIADKVGLKINKIIPSSFATYALIFERYKDELVGKTIAVADIGAGMTDMCIIQHGRLASSRSFAYGGNNLTQTYEREYDLSFQGAEEQKIRKASLQAGAEEPFTRQWADSLAIQISQSFRAFAGDSRTDAIDSLWICGGSSQIPGLDKYLSDKLGVNVVVWEPLQGIEGESVEPEVRKGFSTSLGLGILGLYPSKAATVDANLIPKERKEREEKTRRKIAMVFATIAAILVLALATIGIVTWQNSKKATYNKIATELKKAEQKEEVSRAKVSLENSILMQHIMTPYVTPLEVLREMSDKLPERKRIALTNLNIDKKGRVTMGVEASSHSDVSEVIQTLNELKFLGGANLFKEVKHGAISKITKENRPILQVQISCVLNEKAAEGNDQQLVSSSQ